ncbi:MAG: TetR/AcrR family transcriptional regulator [Streptosporangiaceae bacterium]
MSRRERPAKPALTRDGIFAAAVRLMQAEGLDRVTMRRLAQELDTGAASLYVYVRNTAELHAAMLEQLLGAVDLSPVTAAGDWRDRLVSVLWSYTRILFGQPGLAQSVLVTRPSGPAYLSLAEGVLALLSGGVSADRAAWAVDILLHFATATSTAAEQGTRERAIDAGDEEDALAVALRAAPAGTFPHIAALGVDELLSGGEERLTWGFRVLISGILQTPRPQPASGPGSLPASP